jgi:hypothetical protein
MPIYGAKTQYATKDETPPLTSKQCLTIQKVTGSVLYYARAVDLTRLMPLNDIETEQTKTTEKTQAATNQLLDYLATHPDATIRYHPSNMILHIHSNASLLIMTLLKLWDSSSNFKHARARSLVGWLCGRLDLSVRPCGRTTGVAGVGVV